jgi:hypothetical protein
MHWNAHDLDLIMTHYEDTVEHHLSVLADLDEVAVGVTH